MKIPGIFAVALVIVGPVGAYGQAQTSVGRGCTTATYADNDCDGYGVARRSSGVYPIGDSGSYQYTIGDLPDADDEDPSVNTTASWEAKWGAGNVGIRAFLAARRGFTNTSRIYYIAPAGNDATGVMNDPKHPYATAVTARTGLHDLQGGVVVIRGGTYATLDLSDCGNGAPCYGFTGTANTPTYIMAYPGERVVLNKGWSHGTGYWPNKDMRYVTVDGLVFYQPAWSGGYGGYGVSLTDADHVTVRDCEFAGWRMTMFGNHSEDILLEGNVYHDFGAHAVYLGWSGYVNPYGAADFDFADNEAKYQAGLVPGASYRVTIRDNVIYNVGLDGFEPLHINCYIEGVLLEGNILSYNCAGIGLQTGVYHAVVRNNVILDSASTPIILSLYYYANLVEPATIRYILIENNTLWVGPYSTGLIRGKNPAYGVAASDGSGQGRWIKDVTVRNNILVTQNGGTNAHPQLLFQANSYPDTWIITNNLFWGTQESPTSSDLVATIASTAYPDGHDAGSYTMVTLPSKVRSWSGNLYANPLFKAASTSYTLTPWQFDLGLSAGSPAIKAGAAGGATVDARRLLRGAPPDIGAYNWGVVPGTPAKVVVR